MDKVKPGWRTTEFWLTLIAQVLPVLVITGVLTGGEVAAIQGTLADAVKAVGALIAALIPVWRYIDSRAKVKAGG